MEAKEELEHVLFYKGLDGGVRVAEPTGGWRILHFHPDPSKGKPVAILQLEVSYREYVIEDRGFFFGRESVLKTVTKWVDESDLESLVTKTFPENRCGEDKENV